LLFLILVLSTFQDTLVSLGFSKNMTAISTSKNMIKVYYSSTSNLGKQTVGYVNASYKNILTVDIMKSNVTGTQWKDMAEQLDCTIGDLINQDHPIFKDKYGEGVSLSEDGWIKILDESPEVMTDAIVIIGNDFFLIKNPSEIEMKLEPNSKGINERKYIQRDLNGDSNTIDRNKD